MNFRQIIPFLIALLSSNLFDTQANEVIEISKTFNNSLHKASNIILQNCFRNVSIKEPKSGFSVMKNCLRRLSLRALDRIGRMEVLELPIGIKLVKMNNTDLFKKGRNLRGDFSLKPWTIEAMERVIDILESHRFVLPMSTKDVIEERRRRKDNGMTILLFGMMAMAIIAIPLGFQFLAVLGGKALLLAKLALILTSIQGLKKIATSDMNYGFYQHRNGQGGKPWLYDRRWQLPGGDHHSYEGYDGPEQQMDSGMQYMRPRISENIM